MSAPLAAAAITGSATVLWTIREWLLPLADDDLLLRRSELAVVDDLMDTRGREARCDRNGGMAAAGADTP